MSALPLPIDPSPRPTVVSFPRCPTAERVAAAIVLSQAERVELDRLRWLAVRARLAPKPDLERACFLLAGEPDASLHRYANALFRGLDDHSTREMVFYRPGTRTVSDDESWLLRVLAAWRAGEDKAAAALVCWRVGAAHRRWIRFLTGGLSRALGDDRG